MLAAVCDAPNCAHCGAGMVKARWHTNPTVGIARDHIQGLLRWAFDAGLTREQIIATARHNPTFRHYPADLMKQIVEYVASPKAHPIDAFVFYLITLHTCSVLELLNAQLSGRTIIVITLVGATFSETSHDPTNRL